MARRRGDRCWHGRTPPCMYCAARISAASYYEMLRLLNQMRRAKRKRVGRAAA